MHPSMIALCSTFGTRVNGSSAVKSSSVDIPSLLKRLTQAVTDLCGALRDDDTTDQTQIQDLLESANVVREFMEKKQLTMSYDTYELETQSETVRKSLLSYGRTNAPTGWPHSGGALPVYQDETGTWMTTLVAQLRPLAGNKPFLEFVCGKTERDDTDFTERVQAELGEEAGHIWGEGQDVEVIFDTGSCAKDAGLVNAMERLMVVVSKGRAAQSLSDNEKAQGLGCIEVRVDDLPEIVAAWRSAGGGVAGPLAQLSMGMELQRWLSSQTGEVTGVSEAI